MCVCVCACVRACVRELESESEREKRASTGLPRSYTHVLYIHISQGVSASTGFLRSSIPTTPALTRVWWARTDDRGRITDIQGVHTNREGSLGWRIGLSTIRRCPD